MIEFYKTLKNGEKRLFKINENETRIVERRARKEHNCQNCFKLIKPQEINFEVTYKDKFGVMDFCHFTFYLCRICYKGDKTIAR